MSMADINVVISSVSAAAAIGSASVAFYQTMIGKRALQEAMRGQAESERQILELNQKNDRQYNDVRAELMDKLDKQQTEFMKTTGQRLAEIQDGIDHRLDSINQMSQQAGTYLTGATQSLWDYIHNSLPQELYEKLYPRLRDELSLNDRGSP
jgi:DNA anti-recombination protein RmuC